MSRFAVVKRNDGYLKIFGYETFKYVTIDRFYEYVHTTHIKSITWFDDKDNALQHYNLAGGKEWGVAVSNNDGYTYPLHVLDFCPFDQEIIIKAEFNTSDEADRYCELSNSNDEADAELVGDNSELDSDAWIDEDDSYLTAQDERDYDAELLARLNDSNFDGTMPIEADIDYWLAKMAEAESLSNKD